MARKKGIPRMIEPLHGDDLPEPPPPKTIEEAVQQIREHNERMIQEGLRRIEEFMKDPSKFNVH